MKDAALLNLQILATGNTKDRSKQDRNDGDTRKMFIGRAAAALESFNVTAPSLVR